MRTMSDKQDHLQGYIKLVQDKWLDISFTIPDVDGDLIDEVGIVMEGYSPSKSKTLGVLYLDEFHIGGKSKYSVSIAKQRNEFGTITPFSIDHGAWSKEDGKLMLMCCGSAFAYAGNYYATDYSVTTKVTPINGDSHLILIRAQGAMRSYAAGLDKGGTLAIYKNNFGFSKIAGIKFDWGVGTEYTLKLEAIKNEITLFVDGRPLLGTCDDSFSYGMYGCGSNSMGRTEFGDFIIEEYSVANFMQAENSGC